MEEIKPRLYQETIFNTATKKNTLVVLPTGMGKTLISVMLAKHRLSIFPNSKIIMLAPTKPLAEQHKRTFEKYLEYQTALFTGQVKPEKRAEQWKTTQIIFSTPQGLTNDIINKNIDLKETTLICFDEAHRAVGEYDYCFIAKEYNKKADFPKILALTASPGDILEKITEICNNLKIEEIEVRNEEDPDVKQYIQEIDIKHLYVEFPEEYQKIKEHLDKCIKDKLKQVRDNGFISTIGLNKIELLELQKKLFLRTTRGERSFEILKSISLIAEALKTQHALELLETQGIQQLHNYLTKLEYESERTKTKAVKNLVKDLNFKTALILTNKILEQKQDPPKITEIKKIIKQEVENNSASKTIIFTQYRDTATIIKEQLEKENITSQIFVGQTKKGTTGLSQKEQAQMLEQFKQGQFNVLISTSVGEEGIDIPQVDLVIFHEPVPSAIRQIQRRGRTARLEKGRMIMLITKGTRDESYRWAAQHKEKRMQFLLKDLSNKIKLETPKENTLNNYIKEENKIKITADYREKNGEVLKKLIDEDVDVKLEMLDCTDYFVSDRIGIEVKTTADFVNSIIDGRLLEQLKTMKRTFQRAILIIQGTEDIYSIRNIHPNAIKGMLATIIASYGIPTINTKHAQETAELIKIIAKKEQEYNKNFSPHFEKKTTTIKEQQEYLISAIPNVGTSLAKELLKKFKTPKNIFNSSLEELKQTDGVGEKIAKDIKDVSEKEYEE